MDIRKVFKRDIIKDARRRWLEQYKHYADDYKVGWGSRMEVGEIRARLAKLDLETCSQQELDEAIGAGSSWGANECDICGGDVDVIIRIGDEPDYEARWVDMCPSCLRETSRDFA